MFNRAEQDYCDDNDGYEEGEKKAKKELHDLISDQFKLRRGSKDHTGDGEDEMALVGARCQAAAATTTKINGLTVKVYKPL